MKRIAIITAGGDTPALNATLYGAVARANELEVEVLGLMRGFDGAIDPRVPHVRLNPLFSLIPELDPCVGGSIIGSSRTYIDPKQVEQHKVVAGRLMKLGVEGLICIGGDGTISGMQPLSNFFPCVLAPKTIDNDLGLNYIDEPHEWLREETAPGQYKYRRMSGRDQVDLEEIINYVTPGYATAVYVAAQGVERIRTTAESHCRIALIEVMGRDSGYIALGASYGQPDITLIPEVPLDFERLVERVRELYELQKHVVLVVGEGVVDEQGNQLGAASKSYDPAGNILLSGAAEHLASMLEARLGDDYFRKTGLHHKAASAIFTRKIGHTQRGGRPIMFDRFTATQLGGRAVDLLIREQNNHVATVQWSEKAGFTVSELSANKLQDRWGKIRARTVHPSFWDPKRFKLSELGRDYLKPIFTNAIGRDDMEAIHTKMFSPANLVTRYQSFNVEIQKRLQYLE